MNSGIEEILEFKCCNLLEMNLELIFQNTSDTPVEAPKEFVLQNESQQEKFSNIYPPWQQIIAPGEYASVYCSMDQIIWDRFKKVVITDNQGKEHQFPIPRSSWQLVRLI